MNSAIIASSRLRQQVINPFLNANVAFSLRDLGLGATNSIRVRRTAGTPTEQDFTFTEITDGTLANWVGVGNDGFVTVWYDQLGLNNMIQPNSLKQPQIVENGAVYLDNGKPIIRRTRDNVGLYSSYPINGNKQIFTVVRHTYATLQQGALFGSPTDGSNIGLAYLENNIANPNANMTVSDFKINNIDYTITDRGDLYDQIITKSLFSFDANFTFDENLLGFGYRPNDNMSNLGMPDMQEFILFETPETIEPIQTNINNYYSIY